MHVCVPVCASVWQEARAPLDSARAVGTWQVGAGTCRVRTVVEVRTCPGAAPGIKGRSRAVARSECEHECKMQQKCVHIHVLHTGALEPMKSPRDV